MYAFTLTRQAGQTASTYNFLSLFNPSGSSKKVSVEHAQMANYAVGGAAEPTPFLLSRTTTATGGTLAAASTICQFRTSDPATVAEVRTGNPSVTLGADLWNFTPPFQQSTPGALAPVVQAISFPGDWDRITLLPGQGLVFRQSDIGDADQRLNLIMAWSEQLV